MLLIFLLILLNTTFYSTNARFNPEFEKTVASFVVLHKNIQRELFSILNVVMYGINKNSINNELEVDFNELEEFMRGNINYNLWEQTNEYKLLNKEKNKFKENNNGLLKLKIKEMFKNGVKHILIQNKYYNKLEEQTFCLVNFLLKKFGTDNIIGYEANQVTIIDNHFKINYNRKYYIYRFNQEFNLSNNLYYEGTPEFEELYECNKIIIEAKPQYEVDEYDRKFINLNKLYKRFNPKQLYFNYIPIFEEDQILQVNQDLIENNKEGCSVCLSDFMIGDYVKKTSCGHIFHNNCLQHWLGNNSTCPICRRQIHLTPKLTGL